MDTTHPQSYAQNRSFQHSVALQVLQQHMRWEEGDTVMDVGCGTGEICKYISQQPGVASVVGFDLSRVFISYASQHNSSPNVLYHVADASDVSTIKPEWKGAFSKVVSMYVLHWIRDKAAALRVLHSCLKPGGELLFVCAPDESKFCQVLLEIISHPTWRPYLKDFVINLFPWPSSDLANERHSSRLLEECGFEVLSCQVKNYIQCFDSKDQLRQTIRAVTPYVRYIPQEKHEDFLNDIEKMARDCQWISGEEVPSLNDNSVIVHARKL